MHDPSRSSPSDGSDLVPSVFAPPTTVAPSTTAAAPTLTTVGLDEVSGLMLPTMVPEGWEIGDVTASLSTGRPPGAERTWRWLRRAPDGTVVAQLRAAVYPATEEPSSPNTSVHGLPATTFDSGGGIAVHWQEGGLFVSVIGVAMTEADSLAAAEALVVDVAERSVGFPVGATPDGFEPVIPLDAVPPNPATMNITLVPTTPAAGAFVGISVMPNSDGQTLDSMTDPTATDRGQVVERVVWAGIDRLVQTSPAFELGPLRTAMWLQDGFVVAVSGRNEHLDDIAIGFQPATADQVRSAWAATTGRLAELPVLDSVTLGDGTAVSVRTRGNGASALCVDGPTPRCVEQYSESGLGGEAQANIAHVFRLGDRTVLVGWSREGGQPALQPSGLGVDPSSTSLTAVLDDVIDTPGGGQFIRVDVPAGEPAPQVMYTRPDGTQFGYAAADDPGDLLDR